MKNLLNISATLVVVLFLFSFGGKSEAVGQCPTGFTLKTINMNVGGCIYEVRVCVSCSPLGQGATEVQIVDATLIPPCTPTIPFSSVVDYINSQIKTPSFLFSTLCPNSPPAPPCDGPSDPLVVKYKFPMCWEAEIITYYGENTMVYRSCSDDICEETREICVDGNGAYQITVIALNPAPAVPTCTVEGYDFDFPDPDVDPVGTTTPCYIYHSPCNP